MALHYRVVALSWVVCLGLGTAADAQVRGDGEACLAGSGQVHLDEAYCRRALSRENLAPAERASLLTARASLLLSLGEDEAACADLDRALALNPASAKAYLLRGLMQSSAPMALADLNRAIDLNPFFAEALAYRGRLHFLTADASAALADFARALTIQPGSSPALFFKGVLRFHQGRFDRAAGLFREVLALVPVQHPIAVLWLAAAMARQGGDGGAALEPYIWWWEDGVWPAPLVQLWAGTGTLQQTTAALAAQNGDARVQGAFFIAEWHLAKGERDAARRWRALVRAHPKPFMLEVIVARGRPSD
ncbi:MAG: tetratricopeptide repeat protein [Proteobacteria bacterium]|nr:tetratricopeptide repeat protein [Pseudomonadota bacterium]